MEKANLVSLEKMSGSGSSGERLLSLRTACMVSFVSLNATKYAVFDSP